MYLEKIIFDNRAPFEHLEIDLKDKGVNVLTAINGKGKLLSYRILPTHFMNLPDLLFHENLKAKKLNFTGCHLQITI